MIKYRLCQNPTMNNKTIPALLAVTVMIAVIFAFMPVEQASTVHTTILENTSTLVTVSEQNLLASGDFTITCPAAADACIVKEIFLDDDVADQTVNPVAATYDIDGAGAEAAFDIAADTGAATVGDAVIALTNVANFAMGPSGVLRIEMTPSGGTDYTLTVIAEIEGDNTITV